MVTKTLCLTRERTATENVTNHIVLIRIKAALVTHYFLWRLRACAVHTVTSPMRENSENKACLLLRVLSAMPDAGAGGRCLRMRTYTGRNKVKHVCV